jgi:hypothetical protein
MLENEHLGHTISRASSQKSSLWGPSAQSATFTPAISTCSPLNGNSKTLARQFIVKKKAFRPLHTPGDTFLYFSPSAPLPATPPILEILVPRSYHWIARNFLHQTVTLWLRNSNQQASYATGPPHKITSSRSPIDQWRSLLYTTPKKIHANDTLP